MQRIRRYSIGGKIRKKQKRPWIAAVLPWKGDRAGEAIRKIVFLVALITFLVTGGILLWEMVIQPAMVDNKSKLCTTNLSCG